MSEREDKLLAEQMLKLGRANEEISGDEDSEEEEDTGMGSVDLESTGSGITEWEFGTEDEFEVSLFIFVTVFPLTYILSGGALVYFLLGFFLWITCDIVCSFAGNGFWNV